MIKQGILTEVTKIKDGVGNFGKAWTLWKVILEDGFSATTFENIYSDRIGSAVTLEVEKTTNEGKNGVKYENWRIVPSKPQKRAAPQDNKKYEEIVGLLSEISAIVTATDTKLDSLISRVNKKAEEPLPF